MCQFFLHKKAQNQDWTGDLTLTMGVLYLLSYLGSLYRNDGQLRKLCYADG